MLLIVAQPNDRAAFSVASRWQSHGAALLTARDLSAPGWRFEMPARGPSRFVAGGLGFSSEDVSGVLTRIATVDSVELDHIAPEDRSYVSSEMMAFLLAWLSSLTCPVLNRPTPGGLCGPNWRTEQWIHLAARLGIPVGTVRRSTSVAAAREPAGGSSVTVVGEQCVGAVHPLLSSYARRLAAAAHVELLEVQFSNPEKSGRLQSANLWPDVSRPEIAGAILNFFESRPK